MKRLILAILLLAGWAHSAWADNYPIGGRAEVGWTFSYQLEDTDMTDGVAAAIFPIIRYGQGYATAAGWFPAGQGDRIVDQNAVVVVDLSDWMYGSTEVYFLEDDLYFELTRNTRLTVSGELWVSATAPTNELLDWPNYEFLPERMLTTTHARAGISLDGAGALSTVAVPGAPASRESFQFAVESGPVDYRSFHLHAEMELGGTLDFRDAPTQPVPEPASLVLLAIGLPLVLGLPAWQRRRRRALHAIS